MHDVFNEFHAKNTSKKIRAVVQAKGKSGKRLGVILPYGYRKDENGELIIDEVAAKVVQRIFAMYVSGVNAGTIANTLNSEHLLIRSTYKYEHGIVSKSRACKDPYFWNATTIHKLLDTQEYIGDTVNFKTYSNSYKDSKSRENDKDKRLIFKDTHPAIISTETWEMVQKMRGHKRRYNLVRKVCFRERCFAPIVGKSCISISAEHRPNLLIGIAAPLTARHRETALLTTSKRTRSQKLYLPIYASS